MVGERLVLLVLLVLLLILIIVVAVLVGLLGPLAPLLRVVVIIVIVGGGGRGVARAGGRGASTTAATGDHSRVGAGRALQATCLTGSSVGTVGDKAGVAHTGSTGTQARVAALTSSVGAGVGRAGTAVHSTGQVRPVEGRCCVASAVDAAHGEGGQRGVNGVGVGHPDGGVKGLPGLQLPPLITLNVEHCIGGKAHSGARDATAGPQIEHGDGGGGAVTRQDALGGTSNRVGNEAVGAEAAGVLANACLEQARLALVTA